MQRIAKLLRQIPADYYKASKLFKGVTVQNLKRRTGLDCNDWIRMQCLSEVVGMISCLGHRPQIWTESNLTELSVIGQQPMISPGSGKQNKAATKSIFWSPQAMACVVKVIFVTWGILVPTFAMKEFDTGLRTADVVADLPGDCIFQHKQWLFDLIREKKGFFSDDENLTKCWKCVLKIKKLLKREAPIWIFIKQLFSVGTVTSVTASSMRETLATHTKMIANDHKALFALKKKYQNEWNSHLQVGLHAMRIRHIKATDLFRIWQADDREHSLARNLPPGVMDKSLEQFLAWLAEDMHTSVECLKKTYISLRNISDKVTQGTMASATIETFASGGEDSDPPSSTNLVTRAATNQLWSDEESGNSDDDEEISTKERFPSYVR